MWPRDTPPDTTPEAKQGMQRQAATNPQGRARPAVGNWREMAKDGEAPRPRDAEI